MTAVATRSAVLTLLAAVGLVSGATTIQWDNNLKGRENKVDVQCGSELVLTWSNLTDRVPLRSIWRTTEPNCPSMYLDNLETGLQQLWAEQPTGRVSIFVPDGVIGVFFLADSMGTNCADGTRLTVFVNCANGDKTFALPHNQTLDSLSTLMNEAQADPRYGDPVVNWNLDSFKRASPLTCTNRVRFNWNDGETHSVWMSPDTPPNYQAISNSSCPSSWDANVQLLVGETSDPTQTVVAVSSPLFYHVEAARAHTISFFDGGNNGENCRDRNGFVRMLVVCPPTATVKELVPGLPAWDDSQTRAQLLSLGAFNSPPGKSPRPASPAFNRTLSPSGTAAPSNGAFASSHSILHAAGAAALGAGLLLALL